MRQDILGLCVGGERQKESVEKGRKKKELRLAIAAATRYLPSILTTAAAAAATASMHHAPGCSPGHIS